MAMEIRAVVFDLGGVLFDWSPEYLYRGLIPDPAERQRFLAEICTLEWNHRQDEGRSLAEATRELVVRHPEHAALIEAYYGQWTTMLRGTLTEGVQLFERLEASGVPLFALTNWAGETFRWTRSHYPLLDRFRHIVVSGDEGVAKPHPDIYARMQQVLDAQLPGITPQQVAFLDDSERNVVAARAHGWHAIHHRDANETEQALQGLGLRL